MDDTMKGVLRWVVAAVAMLLIVFITIPLAIDAVTSSVRIGDDTDATAGDGTGVDDGDGLVPVDTAAASATADLSVRNGAVRQATESFVAIGGAPNDAIILAFEQFSGSPECINIVNILFTPLQVTPPTELIVSASTVTNASELADGDTLPDPPYVEEGPQPSVTVEEAGEEHRVNVTELYQAWVTGELTDDPDAAFTVILRPPDTLADRRIQVASIDGDERGPRLSWSGIDGCGVPIGS
jgi:hypothetical protein